MTKTAICLSDDLLTKPTERQTPYNTGRPLKGTLERLEERNLPKNREQEKSVALSMRVQLGPHLRMVANAK